MTLHNPWLKGERERESTGEEENQHLCPQRERGGLNHQYMWISACGHKQKLQHGEVHTNIFAICCTCTLIQILNLPSSDVGIMKCTPYSVLDWSASSKESQTKRKPFFTLMNSLFCKCWHVSVKKEMYSQARLCCQCNSINFSNTFFILYFWIM